MNKKISTTINAAIELEYALSKLYGYYGERFPSESNFWNQLQIEEINHASLLKTAKDFARANAFPKNIILEEASQYYNTIRTIENNMNIACIPDLNAAFEFAYSIEKSSGEIHFQQALTNEDPDKITKIFMELNGRDLNHASRILEHWRVSVLNT